MKTTNYNVRINPEVKAKIVKKRVPNAEFQAAIDECEAMVRGEIPFPPAMSTVEFIESMKEWVDDEV